MNISDIAIRRPVFAWMLMSALILFGGISFVRMGISQLPDVDFPVLQIQLNLKGAAPEVMEADVVDPVEDAVMGLQGVKRVSSVSRNSQAQLTIEFALDRNIDLALQDVQAKLASVNRVLPPQMDPPVVSKINPDDQPILWITLSSTQYPIRTLIQYTRDVLKDQFATVSGVGDIMLGGYIEPNMRVWVDPQKLNLYSLSINDIVRTLQTEHYEPPAGFLDTDRKEYNVRVLGEESTAQGFRNLIISSRGGQPNYARITLGQVAQVEEGLDDARRISRADGKAALGLGIQKQRGSNSVAVAQAVLKKAKSLKTILPKGMDLIVNFDSTRFIKDSVNELNFTLLLSALVTALVCWIFLGSWSSTLNILLAIPTSIVGTFIVLSFAGFTLNYFTLLGLSLVIGIVVDDAIMVLENIVRHREMKKSRMESASVGAREITFAALATSVAIIAIFLPVAFMQGVIGKFFFQFGVTISVAVGLSLVEALTLTPMRCSQFVEVSPRTTRFGQGVEALFHKLSETYHSALTTSLEHPKKTLAAAFAFFVLSLGTTVLIRKEFVPAEDQGMLLFRLQTPVDSSLLYTDSKTKLVEAFLLKRPEVAHFYMAIGGFNGGEVNTAMSFVTLKPYSERPIDARKKHALTQEEFADVCRAAFASIPDLKTTIQDLSMRGFTSSRGFPVEFNVQGPNWEKLAVQTKQLMQELGKTGLVTDLDTDYQEGMPELQIVPNRTQTARYGVSIYDLGEVINVGIGGLRVGQYPDNGHRYDIRVKLPEARQDTLARVQSLFVRNNHGELVPLKKIVRVDVKPTLQAINRINRERAVSVFANLAKGKSLNHVLAKVQDLSSQLAPGYHVTFSGSAETFKEAFFSLIFALVLGIVVAYMVLASQFNSFADPITVLLALPFSISGAFLALWITRQSINLYSMIGLILLMGIVKKNSILLVDFTNQVRDRDQSGRKVALLEACPLRLRAILMTSLATIAGALPAALAIGPGAESRVPMADAVIGGVLVSTVLTLFVVPCAYLYLSPLRRRFTPLLGKSEMPHASGF